MKTKIKIDKNEVIFDIILGLIPLACLIITFRTINSSLIGIYFLVAFCLYYFPKILSCVCPVIEFDNKVIHLHFLWWNKEIEVDNISGYSVDEDYQKTIFCKSKQNITLRMKNTDKIMRFSIKLQSELIEILTEKKIPLFNSIKKYNEETVSKKKLKYIVFFFAIIISNCFFFIFKNQLKKEEKNEIFVLFGINFVYALIYIIVKIISTKENKTR